MHERYHQQPTGTMAFVKVCCLLVLLFLVASFTVTAETEQEDVNGLRQFCETDKNCSALCKGARFAGCIGARCICSGG